MGGGRPNPLLRCNLDDAAFEDDGDTVRDIADDGEIMVIDAEKYFEFGLDELRKNPWLTAKGPPAASEIIFKGEPQWVARSGGRRAS